MMKLLLYAVLCLGVLFNCGLAMANPFAVTYVGETEAGADMVWDLAWEIDWDTNAGERVWYVWFEISDTVASEDISTIVTPEWVFYITTPGCSYYVATESNPFGVPEGAHALVWMLSPREPSIVVGASILDAVGEHAIGQVASGVGGLNLSGADTGYEFLSGPATGLTPEPGSLAVVTMGFALGGYGLARKKKPRRRHQGRH